MTELELEEKLYRENIRLASIDKRILAQIIDDLILSILLFIIISDAISNAQTPEEIIVVINHFVLEFMFIKLFYHAIFTTVYGGSLGKIFLKIEVISTEDFTNISFGQSFLRAFIRLFSEAIFYLGFLWAVFEPNKQSWHDKLAKTIVIYAEK